MQLEVTEYRPDLEPEIMQLQTHLWCTDVNVNAAYFRWKYRDNPYVREPHVYLAVVEGRVAGMRGLYGSRWEHGMAGGRFEPLIADDLVVAPVYANRGLVSRIMAAAFAGAQDAGYSHLLNLSGGGVTVIGSLAMGWKSAGMLAPAGSRSRGARHASRLRAWAARSPLVWRYAERPLLYTRAEREPFGRLDGAARKLPRGSPLSIATAPRADAMAALVRRLGHDGRIRHVRDAEFFSWRYRNPLSEYRFVFRGDPDLDGYLVLQRSISDRRDRRRVRIVDLEAQSPAVCAEMLRFAVREGRFPEVMTWTASLSDELRRLLIDVGFAPIDTRAAARGIPCILVRPLQENAERDQWRLGQLDLRELASWDMRLIYSMAG